MRNRFFFLAALLGLFATGVKGVAPTPAPEDNPEGTTGALKTQVQTGGSYDAHSGNATRSVTDLSVPGALGEYGLDFTRYWNSVHNDDDNPDADWPMDFGASGWSHSWKWTATEGTDTIEEQEGGGEQGRIIYVTSITITFPDGHASKYKLFRSNSPFYGQNPSCVNPTWGPPYRPECGETTEWSDPGVVHDHLRDMAPDGSQFWLVRADGGSVHFVAVGDQYRAIEVYDPHGFRTDLHYNALGDLDEVVQEGGRSLRLIWSSFGTLGRAITKVQTGDGSQYVNYKYQPKYQGTHGFMVLAKAIYPNDPAPGQSAEAFYSYEWPSYSRAPVLRYADDPRFAGPMRTIRYDYLADGCEPWEKPATDPASAAWNYFYARPEAIAAERSGDQLDQSGQQVLVSQFAIGCFTGTRAETNGLGAWRMFYFGRAAGLQEGLYNKGFELGKLTDFTTQNPIPASVPQRRQRGGNQPSTTWDGLNNRTDFLAWNSGHLVDVRYADLSHCTYDWVNPGQSDQPDTSRIHATPYRHWLFQKKDERNQPTTYVRDLRRRIKRIEYPDGSHESYGYDNNGLNQIISHTLPSDATETYVYDPTTHLLIQEYNSVDGFNERKEYTYYGPNNHPEWTGLVETMTDARARISGAPFTVRMTYNGRHQVTSVEYPPTDALAHPTVQYEYDKYGNCIAITNELGHRSTYTYDSYRRCTSYTEPLNAPAWDGNSTVPSRTWNWVYDRVIEGGGQFGPYAHTSREWRIQVEPVSFYPDCRRRVTARTFDVNNRIVSEQTGLTQPCQPPGGWTSGQDTETHRFNYDANGQKSRLIDPRERVTDYVYNNRNLLWKTIEYPMPGSTGTVRTTETLYNAAGDKIKVIFPDGESQEWPDYGYDAFGQPRVFIDENDHTTHLDYWPWGPMKKLAQVTTHRSKDGGGTEDQLTAFNPDLLGRPWRTTFPDGSYEETIYKYGQVESWQNRRRGKKEIDQYDARGRETHHFWRKPNSTDIDPETPAIARIWDAANRLTSIANIFSGIDYKYDDAGQVWWEGNTVNGASGRAQITYWRFPNGEVSRLTYPNGTGVQRFYTARGQLQGVGWGAGSTSYVYHPDGKVDFQARTNGVTTSYGYDGRGMIGLLQHTKDGHDLAKREYWRDQRDRITAWKRGTDPYYNAMEDGRGNRYGYDPEGQLTTASYRAINPETENPTDALRTDSFQYDQLGNRKAQNHVANRGQWMTMTRRDNGLNQYSQWENDRPVPDPAHWGSGIFHDDNFGNPGVPPGNGDVTAEGYLTAGYNGLNQPVGMWSKLYVGTQTYMWFGYDPVGRCVKRWKGPPAAGTPGYPYATYFYYDGWNMVQEGPNAGSSDRTYVHGGRIDEIVASQVSGVWYHHHYDAQGNCILMSASTNGSILAQFDYDAFGWPYFYNAAGGKGAALTRFLFTGREWISDMRLYDYRHRMYQPELGRFLQPDPKQFEAGDYNLYRYCHNDPINNSDPFGLETKIYPGAMSEWAANYNPTDRTVLVAHGNENQGAVDTVNKKIITASTLAKDAIKLGFSAEKPKVDLAICEGGVGGKSSLGQKVANELAARTGVKPDVGAVDGKTALTGTKGDVSGKVTSDPMAGSADPTKGHSGKVLQFTAEPPKKLTKDQ